LRPNETDQPEQPSRALTEEERNEAFCLVTLGRAQEKKARLVRESLEMDAADNEAAEAERALLDLEAGLGSKKAV
jgi:hypothetical protein